MFPLTLNHSSTIYALDLSEFHHYIPLHLLQHQTEHWVVQKLNLNFPAWYGHVVGEDESTSFADNVHTDYAHFEIATPTTL